MSDETDTDPYQRIYAALEPEISRRKKAYRGSRWEEYLESLVPELIAKRLERLEKINREGDRKRRRIPLKEEIVEWW